MKTKVAHPITRCNRYKFAIDYLQLGGCIRVLRTSTVKSDRHSN